MHVFYLCSKEAVGKESEDKRIQATLSPEQDDISLFYSDMMPLLVSNVCCRTVTSINFYINSL